VIRLRFYGDLPFDAVARSVGCSVPTVKSRFRYGIQKIRKLLDREAGTK
jgi:DNA-directed RNA polymerase specialized sigma24 family protein